jgi:hypothetical protein
VIGHIFWVPLVSWLWTRLEHSPPDDPRGRWITVVAVLNGVSLILDVLDGTRYVAGAGSPHLTAAGC